MIELKAISGHEIREDIDYNTRGIDPEDKEWNNYGKELCDTLYYLKPEADKVIAEKDKEIAKLKQKLESVQASMYCDVVDANMENRKLKRALWLARAERAKEKISWFKLWNSSISTMNPEDGARQEYDKWKRNLGKFLKKAEEYK